MQSADSAEMDDTAYTSEKDTGFLCFESYFSKKPKASVPYKLKRLWLLYMHLFRAGNGLLNQSHYGGLREVNWMNNIIKIRS